MQFLGHLHNAYSKKGTAIIVTLLFIFMLVSCTTQQTKFEPESHSEPDSEQINETIKPDATRPKPISNEEAEQNEKREQNKQLKQENQSSEKLKSAEKDASPKASKPEKDQSFMEEEHSTEKPEATESKKETESVDSRSSVAEPSRSQSESNSQRSESESESDSQNQNESKPEPKKEGSSSSASIQQGEKPAKQEKDGNFMQEQYSTKSQTESAHGDSEKGATTAESAQDQNGTVGQIQNADDLKKMGAESIDENLEQHAGSDSSSINPKPNKEITVEGDSKENPVNSSTSSGSTVHTPNHTHTANDKIHGSSHTNHIDHGRLIHEPSHKEKTRYWNMQRPGPTNAEK